MIEDELITAEDAARTLSNMRDSIMRCRGIASYLNMKEGEVYHPLDTYMSSIYDDYLDIKKYVEQNMRMTDNI